MAASCTRCLTGIVQWRVGVTSLPQHESLLVVLPAKEPCHVIMSWAYHIAHEQLFHTCAGEPTALQRVQRAD
jgi:hypothetical protein